jgi:prepilin-type N-terminal cleavage/methylation domain-containing protein
MMTYYLKRKRGFTLVELMVTVAIMAILAAIAAPSIDGIARRTKLDADTERWQSALSFARSEAIKRNALVSVVPSASGFAGGWNVITDDGSTYPDCTLKPVTGELLLRVQEPLASTTKFVFAKDTGNPPIVDCDTPPAAATTCISFNGSGASVDVLGGFLARSMCLRDNNNPTTIYRALTLNSIGQTFTVKVAN